MATSRKAIEFFSIAAIVAILAFLSLSATASAAVINVPGDYTTIQQAINNVTPANRTIEVNATAYNAQGIPETVDVNESDIIIRSINGRAVVSAGGASDHVVNITGQTNVTLQGFEIRDAHGTTKDVAGIYMHNATECTISNNNVTNITATNGHAYGIYLGYSSDNRFSSSTSVSNITGEYAYGIWLENSSDNRFNSSTSVSHITAATQDAYGILLYPFSNNNTFNSSTSVSYISAVNVAYGISLVGASTNTFSSNISVSHVNASSYACGIWLWDSSDNRFRSSTSISTITATNNDAYGIYLFFSSNNNIFSSCTSVSNVTTIFSDAYGISLNNSDNNSFNNTTIRDIAGNSSAYGILMIPAINVTFNLTVIERITAPDGYTYGILMDPVVDGSFIDTTIRDIAGNKIARGIAMNAINVTFDQTVIERVNANASNGEAYGIYADYLISGSFTDTTISDIAGYNTAAGIVMLDAENVSFDPTVIERVNASNGAAFGIVAFIQNGSFTDTTISDIVGYDIAAGIYMDAENVSFDPTVIERVTASAPNGDAYGIYANYLINGSFTDTTIRDISGYDIVAGIYMYPAINVSFLTGELTNCGHGLWLECGEGNRIEGFIIRDNTLFDTGVHLETDTSNTTVCRNCFFNNVLQAWDNGTNNSWIGNYWSDWNGTGSYLINGSAGSEDSSPLDVCPLKVELLPNITAHKVAIDVNGLTLLPGEVICYTVWINNTGNGSSLDNPGNEFEDPIPSNTTYITGSANASSGTIEYSEPNNMIIWNGDIPANGSIVLTFCVTVDLDVPPGTSISNQGTVNYDSDGDRINDVQMLTDDPATALLEDATKLITASPLPPQVQVPAVTPVGLIALAGLLSTIAVLTITRRKRR
jgi:uncharacterized repeat protein (TIGR01451 family)